MVCFWLRGTHFELSSCVNIAQTLGGGKHIYFTLDSCTRHARHSVPRWFEKYPGEFYVPFIYATKSGCRSFGFVYMLEIACTWLSASHNKRRIRLPMLWGLYFLIKNSLIKNAIEINPLNGTMAFSETVWNMRSPEHWYVWTLGQNFSWLLTFLYSYIDYNFTCHFSDFFLKFWI